MNRMPVIVVGIILTFLIPWIGFVAYPYVAPGRFTPMTEETTTDIKNEDLEAAGKLDPRLTQDQAFLNRQADLGRRGAGYTPKFTIGEDGQERLTGAELMNGVTVDSKYTRGDIVDFTAALRDGAIKPEQIPEGIRGQYLDAQGGIRDEIAGVTDDVARNQFNRGRQILKHKGEGWQNLVSEGSGSAIERAFVRQGLGGAFVPDYDSWKNLEGMADKLIKQ